jgi:hypothetical protein
VKQVVIASDGLEDVGLGHSGPDGRGPVAVHFLIVRKRAVLRQEAAFNVNAAVASQEAFRGDERGLKENVLNQPVELAREADRRILRTSSDTFAQSVPS